jgi:hypothetical protein
MLGKASEQDVVACVHGFETLEDAGTSSTLFYLLGVVMKKRKGTEEARRLFEACIAIDYGKRWAGVLAARELVPYLRTTTIRPTVLPERNR